MGEFERLDELLFGQFLGGAFDHDDVVLRADINEVEVADSRICAWVGLATNSPSTRPTRTAPTGPANGMSLTISAALAPLMRACRDRSRRPR